MKYPRMTEATQQVLRELLDDPTAEKYGLDRTYVILLVGLVV